MKVTIDLSKPVKIKWVEDLTSWSYEIKSSLNRKNICFSAYINYSNGFYTLDMYNFIPNVGHTVHDKFDTFAKAETIVVEELTDIGNYLITILKGLQS